jgi:hypothetical protein
MTESNEILVSLLDSLAQSNSEMNRLICLIGESTCHLREELREIRLMMQAHHEEQRKAIEEEDRRARENQEAQRKAMEMLLGQQERLIQTSEIPPYLNLFSESRVPPEMPEPALEDPAPRIHRPRRKQ